MRLVGWCWRCRRVRTVRVEGLRPGTLPVGLCDGCETPDKLGPTDIHGSRPEGGPARHAQPAPHSPEAQR